MRRALSLAFVAAVTVLGAAPMSSASTEVSRALAAPAFGSPTCAGLSKPGGLDRRLDANGWFDQALVSEALIYFSNLERCEQGLQPLAASALLQRAAEGHSRWQADHQTMAHRSTQPGRETLPERVISVGYPYGFLAENLAQTPLYDFQGAPFVIGGPCAFEDTQGASIPVMSYGRTAEYIVDLWMRSPGHRRNLLNEAVTEAGGGAGLAPETEFCGDLYVTMLYARPR